VVLISDQGKYKMTGFSGAEFPKSPLLEAPSTFVLPAGTLGTAINKTIFATGNDDLRPA
jgi:DNA polymerase-3 subunit beta